MILYKYWSEVKIVKDKMRKRGLELLKNLRNDPKKKVELESKILSQLFETRIWQGTEVIAITMSLPFEFNTKPIIEEAWKTGKKCYVPKVLANNQMTFIQITPDTRYEKGVFGIKEPIGDSISSFSKTALMIVPGLIFNREGYRIGQGGGYYDRYLSNYKGITASLVFPQQLSDDWTPEKFDQPVDYIITTEKVIEV
ncbi:5-formyltetrahydrofolate cyclo-ligase [Vagococcus fessus]|uniref:5-formyltetrahydrofolate cyclo-ligase n=1 Tax=Vagococcus fessus TaxID=120370 RepID=A0A430A5D7_9ENTE|nr:5-formyltetrahydrofolate cyclo-ligase [Vagococcus fessus]